MEESKSLVFADNSYYKFCFRSKNRENDRSSVSRPITLRCPRETRASKDDKPQRRGPSRHAMEPFKERLHGVHLGVMAWCLLWRGDGFRNDGRHTIRAVMRGNQSF